jgi:hypothetical protein
MNEPEQLTIDDELETWEQWFASLPTVPFRDEHECFYRGCKTIVTGRYHCDRHEAILQRQRDAQTRRNSARAAAKRGGA